jgi:hypothetical protein
MPKSALSPRLLEASNWVGTDDDVWYMRWRIKLKYIFAYGPRATEWWAKWREYPKTLIAFFGKGQARFESETWKRDSSFDSAWPTSYLFNKEVQIFSQSQIVDNTLTWVVYSGYLSAIQYYTRWHFAIQWPFHIQFHFYFKASDVPVYGVPRPKLDGKLFYFRFGARRDGDKIFWFPSFFAGLTWN